MPESRLADLERRVNTLDKSVQETNLCVAMLIRCLGYHGALTGGMLDLVSGLGVTLQSIVEETLTEEEADQIKLDVALKMASGGYPSAIKAKRNMLEAISAIYNELGKLKERQESHG